MAPLATLERPLGLFATAAVPLAVLVAALLTRGPGALPPSIAAALALPLAMAAVALLVPVRYVCRSLPTAHTPRVRLVATHAFGALTASVIWIYVGAGLARVGAAYAPDADVPALYAANEPTLFATGVLLYAVAAALHYLLIAEDAARRAERQAVELLVLARDAELKALKAQVHPHFLFNSLNSISALTTADPTRAREMCILLAEFFRKSLAFGDKASVTLGQELEVARTYLSIERLRLGERLSVAETVDPDGGECRVPPLILQPLVENAIRHGIATCAAGGVLTVAAHRRDGQLHVLIENPYDPESPARPGVGLGLDNVRRRLAGRYGDAARLSAERSPDRFRVSLQMPAEVA